VQQHPDALTYVAFGDCNTGNPGHCIGDTMNMFIVRQLLRRSREQTRVILYSGFGENRYTDKSTEPAVAAVAEGLGPPNHKMSLNHPTHFYLPEWEVLAGHVHDSKADVAGWSMFPARLLKLVAFSPHNAWSPHWKVSRTRVGHNAIMRELALATRVALLERVHFIPGETSACDWLSSFAKLNSGSVVVKNTAACNISLRGDGGYGYSNVILHLRRDNARRLSNGVEIVEAVAAALVNFTVVDLNLGTLDWQIQGMMVVISRCIFGMHGGAMWNAVRFTVPGQAILEILPVLGPGSTRPLAIAHGVRNEEIECSNCLPQNDHIGSMNPEVVVSALNGLLAVW
jgi:hypothetical protein